MSAIKSVTRHGVLVGLEGSYLAGATLSNATDGIEVVERPDVSLEYSFDGKRPGKSPGTAGMNRNVARSGRSGKVSLLTTPTGPGVAYTNTFTQALNIHRLLRIAGLDAAFSGGVGAEIVTYTPTADGATPASAQVRAFNRGQQYDLLGVYADGFSLDFELGGIPKMKFDCLGTMPNLPVDLATPAITYPNVLPPKASQVNLSIAGYSPARVRSGSLTFKRNVAARLFDASAGAHGGFTPGAEREATLEVIVEAAALASYNPFAVIDAQTAGAISLTLGGTQYNKIALAAANAQLATFDEQEEGPVATWALTFALKCSTPSSNDEFSLIAQ